MRDPIDRTIRDAMRTADSMKIVWANDPMEAEIKTTDREFIHDVANAFARLCDRREKERNRRLHNGGEQGIKS